MPVYTPVDSDGILGPPCAGSVKSLKEVDDCAAAFSIKCRMLYAA